MKPPQMVRVKVACDCGIAIEREGEERALVDMVRVARAEVIEASRLGRCMCKHLETFTTQPLITVTYL